MTSPRCLCHLQDFNPSAIHRQIRSRRSRRNTTKAPLYHVRPTFRLYDTLPSYQFLRRPSPAAPNQSNAARNANRRYSPNPTGASRLTPYPHPEESCEPRRAGESLKKLRGSRLRSRRLKSSGTRCIRGAPRGADST